MAQSIKFLIQHIKFGDIRLYEALNRIDDELLSSTGTITVSSGLVSGSGQNFILEIPTLTADVTINNPILNPPDAAQLVVFITQNATGGHNAFWESGEFFNGPTAGLLTDPDTLSVVTFTGRNGKWYCSGFLTNLSEL